MGSGSALQRCYFLFFGTKEVFDAVVKNICRVGKLGGGGCRLRIGSKASFLAYHYHLIRRFSMEIVQIDGGEAGEGAPSSPLTTD